MSLSNGILPGSLEHLLLGCIVSQQETEAQFPALDILNGGLGNTLSVRI